MRILITTSALALLALSGPAAAQSGQNWERQVTPHTAPYQGSQYGSPTGSYGQQPGSHGTVQQAPHQGQYGYGPGAVAHPRDQRPDGQRTQQRTARGNLAEDVDVALQARGYDVGPADGRLDAQSRSAIRAYERNAGLAVTGEPTQHLLAHIESNQVRAGSSTTSATDTVGGAAGQAVDRFLKTR